MIQGPIERILLIRLRMIGDVLLTTPAVSSVRAAFPDARITYLTGGPARDILLHNPDIDDIMVYDRGIHRRIVARPNYDLTINFDGGPISESVCLLSGARTRIGLSGKSSIRSMSVYNVLPVEPAARGDVIDGFLHLTRAMGIPDHTRKTKLILTGEEQGFADSFVATHAPRADVLIGIHPGGHGGKKLWGAENFAGLADRLTQHPAVRLFVFQGPGEGATAAAVRDGLVRPSQAVLVPFLPLRRYAALVGRCGIFVANDGGPMHIAACLGVGTIGIFNEPEAGFWFPYEEPEGVACFQADRTGPIAVEEVAAACRKLFRRKVERPEL